MDRRSFPPLEDEFTRALLRSAEGDEPSSTAYAKAASALGVGVGVGLGVSASVAPAPAILARSATELASAVRWSSAVGMRLAAFGVSGVLLVGGATILLRGRQLGGASAGLSQSVARSVVPTSQARAESLPSAVAATARADSRTPVVAAPVAPASGSIAPIAPIAPVAPISGSIAPIAPIAPVLPSDAVSKSSGLAAHRRLASARVGEHEEPGSSLAEQVRSLDRARLALRSGQTWAALQEIAHYRAAWPSGVFLTEASVLEIEALAARGERTMAAASAAAFVAAHPDSPQAERLRRLVPKEKP